MTNKFYTCLKSLAVILLSMITGVVLTSIFLREPIAALVIGISLTVAGIVFALICAFKKSITKIIFLILLILSGLGEGFCIGAILAKIAAVSDLPRISGAIISASFVSVIIYIAFAFIASRKFFERFPRTFTYLFIGITIALSILLAVTHNLMLLVFTNLPAVCLAIPLVSDHTDEASMKLKIAIASYIGAIIILIIAIFILAEDGDADGSFLEFLDFDFEAPLKRKKGNNQITKTDF